MSIHKSLRKKRGGSANRSVYTRWERIQILKSNGQWESDNGATGLPKVKTKKLVKKAKK